MSHDQNHTDPSSHICNAIKRKCRHIKPWTIKWGIAANKQWCGKCKTWIYATIDWDGHP